MVGRRARPGLLFAAQSGNERGPRSRSRSGKRPVHAPALIKARVPGGIPISSPGTLFVAI